MPRVLSTIIDSHRVSKYCEIGFKEFEDVSHIIL
jgi:hypothetical protein